jgi:hypothetical protein
MDKEIGNKNKMQVVDGAGTVQNSPVTRKKMLDDEDTEQFDFDTGIRGDHSSDEEDQMGWVRSRHTSEVGSGLAQALASVERDATDLDEKSRLQDLSLNDDNTMMDHHTKDQVSNGNSSRPALRRVRSSVGVRTGRQGSAVSPPFSPPLSTASNNRWSFLSRGTMSPSYYENAVADDSPPASPRPSLRRHVRRSTHGSVAGSYGFPSLMSFTSLDNSPAATTTAIPSFSPSPAPITRLAPPESLSFTAPSIRSRNRALSHPDMADLCRDWLIGGPANDTVTYGPSS